MDRIAAHFSEIGYKRASAKLYIGRLAKFSDFVIRNSRTAKIDQTIIDRFMQSLPTASPRIAARTAIEHARRVAPERFSIPCHAMPDPYGPLLAAFLDHLRRVQGLERKTCEGLLVTARRILVWYNDQVPGQPLAAMTGEHVLALVEHLLSLSTNDYTRTSTTSYTRTFLRFLRWSDLNSQDLARFVPRTPCWRLAHLPPRLPWEDVRRTIGAIDVTTPSGVRDRALLLLLATTGLRNKELRSLELHDIHWRAAEVLVRRTKTGRDRLVPLLQETGEALADYILHARPKIDSQRVFLSYVPPVGPFKSSSPISRIVRSRLERAGIKLSRVAGAHLVRHSLATQLVKQRRPINEVADLLGHRSIDTTAIYVKVALPQLADVALPFPGGAK
ncbi:site-specific integrase [Bradyrhizobium sp.]|jgi:site-specific recombinase XerD|uniref:site-specific integrase n=1 Tax=Bradyrhizobium sp. TaxID=376 RepID=UPI003C704F06